VGPERIPWARRVVGDLKAGDLIDRRLTIRNPFNA
jgi:hypothetical protein